MFYEVIFQSLDKIAVVLIVLVFFLLDYRPPWWKRKENKQRQKVPGPRSIPILGTRWMFYFGIYKFSKIHEFYQDILEKYGPIVREEALFNIPIFHICERQDIEKVLKAPNKFPVRPTIEALVSYRYSRSDRYSSAGVAHEQGEKWHYLRTSLTSDLTSPKLILNFQNDAYNLAEDWCSYLKSERGLNGYIENINDLVVQLSIETSCNLVLGRRLGFMCPNTVSQKSLKLANALQNYFIGMRDIQFSFPLWKYMQTKPYQKMVESEDYVYETVLGMINEFAEENSEGTVYSSIINSTVDDREKTATIIDFIAAGIHTMKNSLIFLFYLAAKHPDLQRKMMNDLNYAKACMTESFRLLPTAAPLARVLDEDMEIAGHQLDAGSIVLCHTNIACRSEENFKFPNDFIPERWLGEERHKTASVGMFLVTPFGIGKRMCPGKRFIELILPIFLQQTLKNFELSTEHFLELEFEFLRAPKGAMSMTFRDRD